MTTERFEPTHANQLADIEPEFNAENKEYTLAMPGSMQSIETNAVTEPIRIRVLLPEGMDQQPELTVVLHLHGSYHSSEEEQSLLDACRESGAVVVSVTTSRRNKVDFAEVALDAMGNGKDAIEAIFAAYQVSFAGKTYPQERDDFVKGIQAGMHSVVDTFRNQRPLHTVILGVSLGGRIAAELSAAIRPEKLVLYAPALDLDQPERLVNPLCRNSSDSVALLEAMHAEQTVVIRGTADANISLEECQRYVDASSQGRLIEIPNARHEIFFEPRNLKKLEEIIATEISAIT